MRGRGLNSLAARVSLTVSPVAESSPMQSEGPRAVNRQPSREQAGVDGAVVAASGEATLGWVEDEPHLPGGRSEAGQPAADVLHTARKADVIQKGKRQVRALARGASSSSTKCRLQSHRKEQRSQRVPLLDPRLRKHRGALEQEATMMSVAPLSVRGEPGSFKRTKHLPQLLAWRWHH